MYKCTCILLLDIAARERRLRAIYKAETLLIFVYTYILTKLDVSKCLSSPQTNGNLTSYLIKITNNNNGFEPNRSV